MSAYLCSPHHIGALAAYITSYRPHRQDYRPYVARLVAEEIPDRDGMGEYSDELGPRVAMILARANLRSVSERYPHDAEGERPGSDHKDLDYVCLCSQAARYRYYDRNPVQVLKAVACLDYQSCEYEEWRGSTARKILDLIEGAAINTLPGYDAAEWGWPDPATVRKVRRVEAAAVEG